MSSTNILFPDSNYPASMLAFLPDARKLATPDKVKADEEGPCERNVRVRDVLISLKMLVVGPMKKGRTWIQWEEVRDVSKISALVEAVRQDPVALFAINVIDGVSGRTGAAVFAKLIPAEEARDVQLQTGNVQVPASPEWYKLCIGFDEQEEEESK